MWTLIKLIIEEFLQMIPCCLLLAMGESEAAEETVSGGQEEGGRSPAGGQALAGPSPQGGVRHPAGHPEVPPPQAPEEGPTGDCQSSGKTVSRDVGFQLRVYLRLRTWLSN